MLFLVHEFELLIELIEKLNQDIKNQKNSLINKLISQKYQKLDRELMQTFKNHIQEIKIKKNLNNPQKAVKLLEFIKEQYMIYTKQEPNFIKELKTNLLNHFTEFHKKFQSKLFLDTEKQGFLSKVIHHIDILKKFKIHNFKDKNFFSNIIDSVKYTPIKNNKKYNEQFNIDNEGIMILENKNSYGEIKKRDLRTFTYINGFSDEIILLIKKHFPQTNYNITQNLVYQLCSLLQKHQYPSPNIQKNNITIIAEQIKKDELQVNVNIISNNYIDKNNETHTFDFPIFYMNYTISVQYNSETKFVKASLQCCECAGFIPEIQKGLIFLDKSNKIDKEYAICQVAKKLNF